MLVRKTKIQLMAFLVISIVAIAYSLIRFTDIEKTFGGGGYTVHLQLSESGGIFTGAEVTYRGHNIGEVGELSLTENGLQAELDIDADAPEVPSDLHAVVANRSAVGEQYVDLQPMTDRGPFLEDGALIPADRTSTPLGAEEIIADLDRLAGAVPTEALQTVVDESYAAFQGTGDDLQVLLDTTRDFTGIAQEHLPQTVQLLEQGNTVLNTQNELAGSMRSFSQDLRDLSATLKDSDEDLRRVIDTAPGAATQISKLLAETGPGLANLVANLLTTSDVLVTRLDGLEQALVTYPVVSVGAYSVVPDDGTAHLGLALNLFDPPACTRGYLPPEEYRPGDETTPRLPKEDAYCAEPYGSPIAVRGSQNAPYQGVPAAPSGKQGQNPGERDQQETAPFPGVPGMFDGPGLNITSLEELVGLPDDQP